jgi:cell division protein FtsQ
MSSSAPASPPPLDVRLMQLGTRLLLGLIVLGLCAVGLSRLVQLPWFSFTRLNVQGEVQHTSDALLRTYALPRLAGGYFTMDLQKTRAVFETVPWVRRAVVRRIWPNQLAVELEEHRPVAFWERDEGDDQLVNLQGEVFEVSLSEIEDENMPTLRGPQGSAPLVLDMLRHLTPIFSALGASIDRLALSERGSWRLTLDGGTVLELGRGQPGEVLERTRRFAATVTQITTRFGHRVEHADLRHNEGYAVRLMGMGTAEQSARPGRR